MKEINLEIDEEVTCFLCGNPAELMTVKDGLFGWIKVCNKCYQRTVVHE